LPIIGASTDTLEGILSGGFVKTALYLLIISREGSSFALLQDVRNTDEKDVIKTPERSKVRSGRYIIKLTFQWLKVVIILLTVKSGRAGEGCRAGV